MPRYYKVSRKERSKERNYLCRVKKRPNPKKTPRETLNTSSASASKIKVSTAKNVPTDPEKHYRIIDFLLVFSSISTLVKCVECGEKVNFTCTGKEGLGFDIQVTCAKCNPRYVPSSTKIGRTFEINSRFVFVMRILGLGLAGCNKFYGLMDLTKNFVTKTTYSDYIHRIVTKVKETAENFFSFAAEEEKKLTKKYENKDEITASGDETSQKQGFNSLYGVTSLSLISSLFCQLCVIWRKKLTPIEFEEWFEEHESSGQCTANHSGASGNMEVNAVIEMFKRSVEKHDVKIGNYVGDGDSKTYGNLIKAKPYGDDLIVAKKECVGHVQKRMGTRLRDLVKSHVGEVPIKTGKNAGKKRRVKTLGGKGKLTAITIDNLSRYYGSANRNNCDSVQKMKDAIWSTFFHQQSTDAHPQHEKCMSGEKSWCPYQRALATTGVENFKHDYFPLPQDVIDAIEPIYKDLTDEKLLERCIGGYTQNANESLNHMIWQIAPKKLSGSLPIVEFAANIAAVTFNEGSGALLSCMHDLGIGLGPSAHAYVKEVDAERIGRAEFNATTQTKEARIQERLDKKMKEDQYIAEGTVLYGAGIDDSV